MLQGTIVRSLCLVFIGCALVASAAAIKDDFNDGNDTTPPWSYVAPVVNGVCTGSGTPYVCCTGTGAGTCATSFDASSFEYQIDITATGNLSDPTRAASTRSGASESFADTVVFAELVDWDDVDDHAYGLFARVDSGNGYALQYVGGGSDELRLFRIGPASQT